MYRYETHLHTKTASACSRFTAEEIIEKYKRLSYAGVFVTDHFLNGNTTVPRSLPYREAIGRYVRGYEEVKRAAEGLAVFFGFEYSYKGTDFLVYGLGAEELCAHPEIMDMRTKEFLRFARQAGALVVQAHPTREADYIDHVRLFPSDVDGFETLNANRTERENYLADVYATAYELRKTAGSDIHHKEQRSLAGMEFLTPLLNEKDFAERVKAGEGSLFSLTDEGVL